MGENRLIFALDPNLKMDTETLVLHSGQKFMCFVVHFHKKFWFWYQTEIVPKKVYAAIWPILEISSLNFHLPFLELLVEQYGQLYLNWPNRPYHSAGNSEKGKWKLILSSVLWCPNYMLSDFNMLHLVAIWKGIMVVLGACGTVALLKATNYVFLHIT